MALYALGDLHLALGADKPMDVFGGKWAGYMDKLEASLSVLRPEDTLVIAGDFCWALGLEEAGPDFRFLNRFPGRKLLVKGNHDYWWNTAAKFRRFCEANGLEQMDLLHNNCHFYGDIALCGTRGWFFEEEKEGLWRGHAPNYVEVMARGEALHNVIRDVNITELHGDGLFGQVL